MLAGAASMGGVAAYVWYDAWLRRRTLDRLRAEHTVVDEGVAWQPVAFPPRYRTLPGVAGALVAAGLVLAGWPLVYVLAFAVMTGVLALLVEEYIAERRVIGIEQQLAEAIDLIVGALRAGAALLGAFEATARETDAPLRTYLEEITGRIRLGDDPDEAMRELADRVPLETFRLFALTLAVHWEAGGSLAATLSTVGRTIRDRIELTRRVAAQSVESKVSSIGVLGITYAIAFVAWRTSPGPFEAFVSGDIGSLLVSAAIVLQAIGLLWMDRLSRIRF